MHKLILTGLVVAGVVAFVGTDVVGATVTRARASVRASLQKDVPLSTRLSEARAQVDAFAENVIRGEVAAERLAEMIEETRREVARRRGGLDRERQSLSTLKAGLEAQPTARLVSDGPARTSDVEREALRRARDFQVATTLLERRERDLAGLERDHQATVREVEAAKSQQMRLSEEVNVLRAEVAALDARTNVARTRKACQDSTIDRSGFGEAEARIQAIRDAIREQNKKLEWYSLRADVSRSVADDDGLSGDAIEALRSVLEPGAPLSPAGR